MRILMLAAAAIAAFPIAAQEPPIAVVRVRPCAPPDCVLANYQDLTDLMNRSNENYARALKAEARVLELESGGPKCAKVEVTEPPKPIIVPDPATAKRS